MFKARKDHNTAALTQMNMPNSASHTISLDREFANVSDREGLSLIPPTAREFAEPFCSDMSTLFGSEWTLKQVRHSRQCRSCIWSCDRPWHTAAPRDRRLCLSLKSVAFPALEANFKTSTPATAFGVRQALQWTIKPRNFWLMWKAESCP